MKNFHSILTILPFLLIFLAILVGIYHVFTYW